MRLREAAITGVRQITVAVVTAIIVILILTLFYGGQAQREEEAQQQGIQASLATACVLALPVDPTTGRDPALVRQCFLSYGFDPPVVLNP